VQSNTAQGGVAEHRTAHSRQAIPGRKIRAVMMDVVILLFFADWKYSVCWDSRLLKILGPFLRRRYEQHSMQIKE
jgi:hypothetical protein